jgi:hypothetical protein
MDKEVAKHIRKTKRKEKQYKQARKAIMIMIAMEWAIERELTRYQ